MNRSIRKSEIVQILTIKARRIVENQLVGYFALVESGPGIGLVRTIHHNSKSDEKNQVKLYFYTIYDSFFGNPIYLQAKNKLSIFPITTKNLVKYHPKIRKYPFPFQTAGVPKFVFPKLSSQQKIILKKLKLKPAIMTEAMPKTKKGEKICL